MVISPRAQRRLHRADPRKALQRQTFHGLQPHLRDPRTRPTLYRYTAPALVAGEHVQRAERDLYALNSVLHLPFGGETPIVGQCNSYNAFI